MPLRREPRRPPARPALTTMTPTRSSASRRLARPRLETLEDRSVPAAAAWAGFAHDPQHTGISLFASQPLQGIRWSSAVDMNPQYSGNDLLIHYGSPVV